MTCQPLSASCFLYICPYIGCLDDVKRLSVRGEDARTAQMFADGFVICISTTSLQFPQHTAVNFRKVVTTLFLHYLKAPAIPGVFSHQPLDWLSKQMKPRTRFEMFPHVKIFGNQNCCAQRLHEALFGHKSSSCSNS